MPWHRFGVFLPHEESPGSRERLRTAGGSTLREMVTALELHPLEVKYGGIEHYLYQGSLWTTSLLGNTGFVSYTSISLSCSQLRIYQLVGSCGDRVRVHAPLIQANVTCGGVQSVAITWRQNTSYHEMDSYMNPPIT